MDSDRFCPNTPGRFEKHACFTRTVEALWTDDASVCVGHARELDTWLCCITAFTVPILRDVTWYLV